MINEAAFQPDTLSTSQINNTVLTGGAASQNVAVLPGTVLRLVNTHATQSANFNFGALSTVAAVAASDMILLAGQTLYVRVPNNCLFMAYVASGATTLIHMTKGI